MAKASKAAAKKSAPAKKSATPVKNITAAASKAAAKKDELNDLQKRIIAQYQQRIDAGEFGAQMITEQIQLELDKSTELEPEEIADVIVALSTYEAKAPGSQQGTQQAPKVKKAAKGEYDPANPNAHVLELLSGINYKELSDRNNFKKYCEVAGDERVVDKDALENIEGYQRGIAGVLDLNRNYDYVKMKVTPVRVQRYKGVEGSPLDFVGLRITDDTPVFTTRITKRVADELNQQILNAHNLAGKGFYYLLKK